jgi:hypothetical protein
VLRRSCSTRIDTFGGDYRQDIDHSSQPGKQGISSANGTAMALKSVQMSSDDRPRTAKPLMALPLSTTTPAGS